MCQWCGTILRDGPGFALVERGAERLSGRFWEGTPGEAAAGAARDLIAAVGEVSRAAGSGAVISLSWMEGPELLRCFAGVSATGPVAALSERLDFPPMRFVLGLHEGDGGGDDVIEHYRHMLDWMEAEGLRRDRTRYHHREEYVSVTPSGRAGGPLRLMLPVAGGPGAGTSRFAATAV